MGRCKQKQCRLRGLLCRWPSITEWEMYITAQGPRIRNDLYCVEWDVKLYYTIPYFPKGGALALLNFVVSLCLCLHTSNRITEFGVVTHMGRSWLSGGQPRCPPNNQSTKGVASAELNFWRFFPAHAYAVWPRATKFSVVTHMERGMFWGSVTIAYCTNALLGLSAIAEL